MAPIAAAATLFAQAANLPPAYPRPGANTLFENARVQVWDTSWLKQPSAVYRHPYTLVGVYSSTGE